MKIHFELSDTSAKECLLLDMIRESKDPSKAPEVAIWVLVEFLGGVYT